MKLTFEPPEVFFIRQAAALSNEKETTEAKRSPDCDAIHAGNERMLRKGWSEEPWSKRSNVSGMWVGGWCEARS